MKGKNWDLIVIGGGAAGYFGAIAAAEASGFRVLVLEQSKQVLSKVKISGGGRCNVTHACFDPRELTEFYPRGAKALLGPFHRFMTGDTMSWFEEQGVPLKIEEDGRVFPVSNQSQSIIDCLTTRAKQLGIQVWTRTPVRALQPPSGPETPWKLHTSQGILEAHSVLVATGSSTRMWENLERLGHTIEPPVPSLFTFNIADPRIKPLPGLSVPEAEVSVVGSSLRATGPLLITHWGLSGPAVLRLSAWGARELHDQQYNFRLRVNWEAEVKEADWQNTWRQLRRDRPRQQIASSPQRGLPTRLWQALCNAAGISLSLTWAHMSKQQADMLATQLSQSEFAVSGKSTFKDEFVTCGGVRLNEVDMRSMQSKRLPRLYLAGEVLDIDAITGGFNFQAAWTTSWLAAQAISRVGPVKATN